MANSSGIPDVSGSESPVPPPPPPPSAPAPVRKGTPLPPSASTPQAPAQGNPQSLRSPSAVPAPNPASDKANANRWRGSVPASQNSQRAAGSNAEDPAVDGQYEEETLDPIREAPAWLLSLIVHLVILLLLALFTLPASMGLGPLLITLGASEEGEEIALSNFTLDATEAPNIDEVIDQEFDIEQEDLILEEIVQPTELLQVQTEQLVEVGLSQMTTEIRAALSGRTGSTKQALLAAMGGTGETQDAVTLGLAWLARQQRRDGSWSLTGRYSDGAAGENKQAATAMALLAFQGDGNTHESGPYKDAVKKGITWLLKQQDREGSFVHKSNRPPGHQLLYAQGQCMIAICELYAMTHDTELREPAQRSIDYAVEIQSKQGGWRYRPYGDSDTSVTGWFMMGLQSGRMAGLEVPGGSLMKISYFLDSVEHYDGSAYSYRAGTGNQPSPSMTAEGLLCRQYLGWKKDNPALVEAAFTIADRYNFSIGERNFYYWYYGSQVLHHFGGEPWEKWNNKMRVDLPKEQVKSGAEAGSWSPAGSAWGSTGGRLYTTCLAIYCLEVYYRHMPLYKHDQVVPASRPSEFKPREN